jgi:GTP cyclohydrolase I
MKNYHESDVASAVAQIITSLGEDLARPGLRDTPMRVTKSFAELTSGYGVNPADIVSDALFPCASAGMILQKGIEFYSLCEHHLLPFFGEVHLAYFPHEKIIGLSKIGRLIDVYAKRLQVQENLTHQIVDALTNLLHPKGIAIVVEARHFCMMMRGVKKQNGLTVTCEYTGAFKTDHDLRMNFLEAIKK